MICIRYIGRWTIRYEVQLGQALTAGYFGGYSAKMQDVGKKELQMMEEAMGSKIDKSTEESPGQQFAAFSKRLVKDLEAKGTLHTTVESTNLMVNLTKNDALSAECVRTFPTVQFPAMALLRREEVETGKVSGVQMIVAVHATGTARSRRSYLEAPFDLLYGFRSGDHNVQLLSAFEMIMHWQMVEVRPPSPAHTLSQLTCEGEAYKQECKDLGRVPKYNAGQHFIAVGAANRLLLPELKQLGVLCHRWIWERRPRPCVPVWSSSKLAAARYSPEENARLMSIYMRPWTLNPEQSSMDVPLLSGMANYLQDLVNPLSKNPDAPIDTIIAPRKVRKIASKKSEPNIPSTRYIKSRSYSCTWARYIDGNVVSETSRQYIVNMLAATAANFVTREDSTSEDIEEVECDVERFGGKVGSLDLVHKTLQGIASRDVDEGCLSSGRYAASVVLGKELWSSRDLTREENEVEGAQLWKWYIPTNEGCTPGDA